MATASYTLAELEHAVRDACAQLGLVQGNGQVADIPNARTVRYYATTGLLDRPEHDGRQARYGHKHLLQLVAIKRLQAAGQTLAQIQRALVGKSVRALADIAALPVTPLAATLPAAPAPEAPRRARAFWAEAAAPPAPAAPAPAEHPTADVPAVEAAPAAVAGVVSEGLQLTFAAARALSADELRMVAQLLSPVHAFLSARGALAPSAAPTASLSGVRNTKEEP